MKDYMIRVVSAWALLYIAGKVLKSAEGVLKSATDSPRTPAETLEDRIQAAASTEVEA